MGDLLTGCCHWDKVICLWDCAGPGRLAEHLLNLMVRISLTLPKHCVLRSPCRQRLSHLWVPSVLPQVLGKHRVWRCPINVWRVNEWMDKWKGKIVVYLLIFPNPGKTFARTNIWTDDALPRLRKLNWKEQESTGLCFVASTGFAWELLVLPPFSLFYPPLCCWTSKAWKGKLQISVVLKPLSVFLRNWSGS